MLIMRSEDKMSRREGKIYRSDIEDWVGIYLFMSMVLGTAENIRDSR